MRSTRSARIAACTLLLFPMVAAAQDAPPPRHEATGEVAYVGVSGNASTSTFGVGFEVIDRPDSWLLRNRFNFVRNKSEGSLIAQSLQYAPRVEKSIAAHLSAFVDYEYFRDKLAGVAHRNAVGGGLSAKVVESERHTLALDAGAGWLDEARLTGADVSSGYWAGRIGFKVALSSSADIADDASIVGVFDKGSDWRLDQRVALSAKLTSAFSLKVSNNLRYANFPAPGFKKTDTITSVALVAKLKSGS